MAPSVMENSYTMGAKERPACGRAVTGKCEMDMSRAGRERSEAFCTGRPVSGLTPGGKSAAFGPKVKGVARGCGVGRGVAVSGARVAGG